MTYWTLMLITLIGGPLDGAMVEIPYRTQPDCEAAVITVTDTLKQDYKVQCYVTATASGSVRPRAKPELEDDK